MALLLIDRLRNAVTSCTLWLITAVAVTLVLWGAELVEGARIDCASRDESNPASPYESKLCSDSFTTALEGACAGASDRQVAVAYRYASGLGTQRDLPRARAWMEYARANGRIEEASRFGLLWSQLIPPTPTEIRSEVRRESGTGPALARNGVTDTTVLHTGVRLGFDGTNWRPDPGDPLCQLSASSTVERAQVVLATAPTTVTTYELLLPHDAFGPTCAQESEAFQEGLTASGIDVIRRGRMMTLLIGPGVFDVDHRLRCDSSNKESDLARVAVACPRALEPEGITATPYSLSGSALRRIGSELPETDRILARWRVSSDAHLGSLVERLSWRIEGEATAEGSIRFSYSEPFLYAIGPSGSVIRRARLVAEFGRGNGLAPCPVWRSDSLIDIPVVTRQPTEHRCPTCPANACGPC